MKLTALFEKKLSKEERSRIVKMAKKGKDLGKSGKNFEKIAKKAAKRYGSEEAGRRVAAAIMWKNLAKNESVEAANAALETLYEGYLSKKERSAIVKLAKEKHDFGKKGKMFDKIAKEAAKRYGSEEIGRRVAGAIFWKMMAKRSD